MIATTCKHHNFKSVGSVRGVKRYKCCDCGVTFSAAKQKPLGDMTVDLNKAKLALRMLTEGMSIRATERTTSIHRDTLCKMIVLFGTACRKFLDDRMHGLKMTHLQFDEQWTFVGKKQSRLTVDEKETCFNMGDIYLWTCVDEQTKLMPSFLIGKRSADNARRFMSDVAKRLARPAPHASDAHGFAKGGYLPIVQISTDGFPGYPEAVDLAFGPYAKYGVIIKEYKNAKMAYTPSEMVGAKRTGIRGIEGRALRTIGTSHVERLNCTQRVFMKRLNRLTLCFSKKLENLEAAFGMFAAYYNFCWQTRYPDKSGKRGQKRPSAAMMAKLSGHVWSFDELFDEVLAA
ncbi:MAG: hypothetical protein H6822_19740 [Planctomycetaceae bacterium]|nr:IS1 family transposase [Planctomycetales bacterium]MCB9924421.1 hypothetical protein [Planctomycetaceae bacterium]